MLFHGNCPCYFHVDLALIFNDRFYRNFIDHKGCPLWRYDRVVIVIPWCVVAQIRQKYPEESESLYTGSLRGTERCSTNCRIISVMKCLKMFVAQNSHIYLSIVSTYYDSLYVIIWKPNCWPSEIIKAFNEDDKRPLFTSQTVLSVSKSICKHHRPTSHVRLWKWSGDQ